MKARAVIASIALAAGSPAAARPAAEVPDQPWYPAGYLAIRKAAAEQVETFPREPMYYDLVDCGLGEDLPEDLSGNDRELALLALDVARIRSELADLAYPPEVYDQPLLDYERWMLGGDAPSWAARLLELEQIPAIPFEELGDDVEWTDQMEADLELRNFGALAALKQELEARRDRLSPRKPHFTVEGGCGAGEAPFKIELVPANGELWLINAFAFRVCEQKVSDPWNHAACGWSQYATGDTTYASGRYMYEARWGSQVQRGAKVLQGDLGSSEDAETITIRRN